MDVMRITKGNRCDNMEEFDLDSEYKNVIELLNSPVFTRLKEKVEKKDVSKKEYKMFNRLNIVEENMDFLNNIMNYIKDMKHEIKEIQKERKLKMEYREEQRQEKQLNIHIKNEKRGINVLKKTLLLEQLDEEEKKCIGEEIDKSEDIIKEIQKKLEDISNKKAEYEMMKTKYPRLPEEQRKIVLHLQEKINQCSIVAEKLIKGHTLEDSLEYLMTWQRKRYKLEKRDNYTIQRDIEKIEIDKRIGNEIVNIAYHYDEKNEQDR